MSNGQLPEVQGPTAPAQQPAVAENFDPIAFNDRVATSSALGEVKNQTNALSTVLNDLTGRVATLENNASSSAFMAPPSGTNFASADELELNTLDAKDVTVTNTLAVAGRTTLSDVGITGKMNIGLLSIEGLDDDGEASINTSVGALKLQSNGLNGIDILGGKMTIDTKGNIKTEGEITAKKVNIDTEDVASASLGDATIESGQTKVTVTTKALTPKSKIFVEAQEIPVSTATKKVATDKFEIRIKSAEPTDVKLQWWIVN